VLGVALFAQSARADVAISRAANRHFKAGVQALRSDDPGRYEKAYAEFRAAYADSPSWKILGNLGIIAQQLERDGEAIDAYSRYLSEGGKELAASEREQVTEDLARLEVGHATATLQSEPDGARILDERLLESGSPVTNRYGPTNGPLELRLRAGHHRITAELDGYVTVTWEFEAQPGARALHTFELQRAGEPSTAPPPPISPAAPSEPPLDERAAPEDGGGSASRILGYTALGVGAAGIGAGVWFMTQVNAAIHDGDAAQSQCVGAGLQICPQSAHYTRVEGHRRTEALVSFGAAGAFVTTGVLLLVYGADSGPASEQAGISPWIGAHQLGLSGRF
jgi:hypothetical protein